MSGADDDDDYNTFYIFGHDVAKIPCYKETFLYAIATGVGSGLATFMFTSRPQLAMKASGAGYFTVACGYWVYCRYNYSTNKFKVAQYQKALERRMALGDLDDRKPPISEA